MFHIWDGNRRLKLGIHTSMKSMHVWVTSSMFDANMDNHGVLQSIMEGVNV